MGMERRGQLILFRRGVNQVLGRNPPAKRSHWLGEKSRMSREAPVRFCEGLGVKLPRATRLIIHAKSRAQAEQVLEAVRQRLRECRLELHPEKTKIVYCQDSDRKGQHEHIQFDFLGYTFRPRRAKNRWGKFFVSFLPAISNKAAQAIQETIRNWRLAATRNNQSLEDIARLVNPSVRGWVNYYGRFYRSALTPALRHLERALIRWACRKYKRLRRHYTNAAHWLGRVARRDPQLFVMWQLGIRPAIGS
jgi:RNA-directed DNA polymerase